MRLEKTKRKKKLWRADFFDVKMHSGTKIGAAKLKSFVSRKLRTDLHVQLGQPTRQAGKIDRI